MTWFYILAAIYALLGLWLVLKPKDYLRYRERIERLSEGYLESNNYGVPMELIGRAIFNLLTGLFVFVGLLYSISAPLVLLGGASNMLFYLKPTLARWQGAIIFLVCTFVLINDLLIKTDLRLWM
jgi:hypothetical protein